MLKRRYHKDHAPGCLCFCYKRSQYYFAAGNHHCQPPIHHPEGPWSRWRLQKPWLHPRSEAVWGCPSHYPEAAGPARHSGNPPESPSEVVVGQDRADVHCCCFGYFPRSSHSHWVASSGGVPCRFEGFLYWSPEACGWHLK
ncbi:unnamed protein product [Heterosigma akashiwo]